MLLMVLFSLSELSCLETGTLGLRFLLTGFRFYDGATTNIPTMAKVLSNASAGFSILSSGISWTNRKRFVILKDKVYKIGNGDWVGSLPASDVLANNGRAIYKNWHIKLKTKAKYVLPGGSPALIGDAAQNSLFIAFISDNITAPCKVDCAYRLKFQG